MKKLFISLSVILLITYYLPACKKSDKDPSTIEKIQGKWQLDSDVQTHTISGQADVTTITGAAGDIVDFRTDGKIYVDIGGSKDTSTYALSGDTKMVLDGTQVFDIITLTANSFIFYNKETSGSSDFDEVTITLKK